MQMAQGRNYLPDTCSWMWGREGDETKLRLQKDKWVGHTGED